MTPEPALPWYRAVPAVPHPPRRLGRRHRLALLTWAGVYPLLTVIALLLEPLLDGLPLPLPLRTFATSAVMVPAMVYGLMPLIRRFALPPSASDR